MQWKSISKVIAFESEKLVFVKDASSWKSLLGAARIRNLKPVLDIEETLQENEVPNIIYHQKCRMLFTMKDIVLQEETRIKLRKDHSKR